MDVRLRSWAHRDDLDERLAAGEPVEASPELGFRADRLQSRHLRQSLAESIDNALRCAEVGVINSPLDCAHLPVDLDEVLDARPELELLARRLRQPGQVDPRGVALTRLLLASTSSPLHSGGRHHDVRDRAAAAAAALGEPMPVAAVW